MHLLLDPSGKGRHVADSAQFTITYDGPGVVPGRMNAAQLGGAMLSMAQLIEASAALTFGATTKIGVDVTADFKRSSFSYQLIAYLSSDLGPQVIQSIDMGHLLAIIGITGGGGLIGLIRFLRHRKPKEVSRVNSDNVEVKTEDGDSYVVNARTVNLFNNSTILLHMNGAVAPLRQEGISELRTGRDRPETIIRADEVEYFEPMAGEGETLQDRTATEIVQVVGPKFLPGRKWELRLVDGTPFNSSLDDEYSGHVLHHDVEFGAGDALEVEMRTVVTREASGPLRARREVVRVIRKIPAPRQIDLDLGDS